MCYLALIYFYLLDMLAASFLLYSFNNTGTAIINYWFFFPQLDVYDGKGSGEGMLM